MIALRDFAHVIDGARDALICSHILHDRNDRAQRAIVLHANAA